MFKLVSEDSAIGGTSYSLYHDNLLYRMHRLATMRRIGDRRTDDSMMPIADHITCSMIG